MNKRFERGCALYENKRFEMAEREFLAALAEEPDSAPTHRMLALSLLYQSKMEPALAAANEAVAIDPEDDYSHYVVCLILHKQGKYREAERAIDEAKELNPNYAEYHTQDAVLALEQNLLKEAEMKIEHAISLDPTDERALRVLATIAMRSGKLKEATELTREALKLAPEGAHAQALMGNLLQKQKKTGEAIQHYREALRINPTLEWAREGYLEALNSRNPLYGFILSFIWLTERPIRIIWFNVYVIGISIVLYIVMAVVGTIMKHISKHLLTMFMRFDPVAVEALDYNEIKQSNILAIWIACSMLISTGLLFLCPMHPFFLPAVVFLYGAPLIFTRLFELRDDPQALAEYKIYCYVAASIGLLAIVFSFGPDTLKVKNLPANIQDASGILIFAFMLMTLFSRRFPWRSGTGTPLKT